jgi:hypothetical protein
VPEDTDADREPLASFETDSVSGYSEKMGLGEMVDMEFNITIPKLFSRCSVAGDCVSLLNDAAGDL